MFCFSFAVTGTHNKSQFNSSSSTLQLLVRERINSFCFSLHISDSIFLFIHLYKWIFNVRKWWIIRTRERERERVSDTPKHIETAQRMWTENSLSPIWFVIRSFALATDCRFVVVVVVVTMPLGRHNSALEHVFCFYRSSFSHLILCNGIRDDISRCL